MEQFEAAFKALLRELDAATLDSEHSVVFGVNGKLELAYVNSAWHRFAAANGDNGTLVGRFGIGAPILDAISGPLRDFYARSYAGVLGGTEIWRHDYECSSPETYRVFHQTVYPLRDRAGLLVVNSLAVSAPMNAERREAMPAQPQLYRNAAGLITQCSHCRRVQRADDAERWDWVPDWVREMPLELSHGLCDYCYAYYYRYRLFDPRRS